jgi:uncharacterized protein
MNNKKIPLRKCIVSQEMKPKKEMIRVVRSPEGVVSVDLTGKKSGRGTYLTKDKEIILAAKQRNIISKQLKAEVDPSLFDELLQHVEQNK